SAVADAMGTSDGTTEGAAAPEATELADTPTDPLDVPAPSGEALLPHATSTRPAATIAMLTRQPMSQAPRTLPECGAQVSPERFFRRRFSRFLATSRGCPCRGFTIAGGTEMDNATTARYWMIVVGVALLGAGLLGFVAGNPIASSDPNAIFRVNAAHNLVHI